MELGLYALSSLVSLVTSTAAVVPVVPSTFAVVPELPELPSPLVVLLVEVEVDPSGALPRQPGKSKIASVSGDEARRRRGIRGS